VVVQGRLEEVRTEMLAGFALQLSLEASNAAEFARLGGAVAALADQQGAAAAQARRDEVRFAEVAGELLESRAGQAELRAALQEAESRAADLSEQLETAEATMQQLTLQSEEAQRQLAAEREGRAR